MVKITYKPIEEIIVHEAHELPPAQFFQSIVAQMQAQGQTGIVPSVLWLDGIAFSIGNFGVSNDRLIEDQINGVVHYAFVNFTRTSFDAEKKPMIAGKEYIVRLVKVENNPNFVALVKFLQGFKE